MSIGNKMLELTSQLDALQTMVNLYLTSVASPIIEEFNQVFQNFHLQLRLHQANVEKQKKELQRTQAALEKTKAHYVDLYDNAPVGYLTVDEEGVIREINMTAVNLIGSHRKQILNQPFVNFISDNYKVIWDGHFQGAKHKFELEGCELPFNQKNGKPLFLHINCRYFHVADSLQSIRVTLTDVTERKLAEENLRIAAAAFEAQEGILVTDVKKIILRVNQAFTDMTGYSGNEVVGNTPELLRAGLYEDSFYDNIFNIVENDGFWQGELWDKRKNGELFPVFETITAVRDEQGQLTHYVGTMLDITAQKQAEKVLLEARARLEKQVANSQEELDKIKAETIEVNTALNVLLRQRETDKNEAQMAFSNEVEATVLPLLKKLKAESTGRYQSIRLIKILEENLQQLVKCYGRASHFAAINQKLTPLETQVATMIRQGQSTKVIAAALNIAPGTVSIHRKHIRKKLGLDSKKDNLQGYLQSLIE